MKLLESFLFLCCVTMPLRATEDIRLHVSARGNDRWTGSLPRPSHTMSDGPVATLQRALTLGQERIRSAGRTARVRILIGEGTYTLYDGLTISGPGAERMTISGSGHVVLSGGRPVHGWKRVSDGDIRRRLAPAARNHVLVADLASQGINSFGSITPRGGPGFELFFRGKRMVLARWPDAGWEQIADVPQTGDTLYNEGLARERRVQDVPVGRHYGRIRYHGDRPSQWKEETEIILHGFWTWDWSDSYQRVARIDTGTKEITLALPHHHYGYTTNQRYYFLNILGELDRPGEWYLDRSHGLLYFWPPELIRGDEAVVSLLDAPLLTIAGGRAVTVERLTFETSRGRGVVIAGGDSVLIAGCTFRNLGGDAVAIDSGSHHEVRSCDIFDVAMGGIRLTGGDRTALTPAGHAAVNNHIYRYSTWLGTGQYAVWLAGVGNRVANNLIHDAPFEALYLMGNDHLVEFNEVHNVTRETGDAGALHTGRDWTWRGNVIRYNYWHHLQGPGLHGVMGVYLDDWASGFTVFGNLFYKAGRATLVGGGRDNVVANNIYLECAPSIHLDARGLGWASYYFGNPDGYLEKQMRAVNGDRPPYTTRYPELATLYADEPALPKGNRIERNISAGGRWMDIYDYLAFDRNIFTVRNNLIADPDLLRRRNDGEGGWDPYYLNIDLKEGYTTYRSGDRGVQGEFPDNTYRSSASGITVELRDGRPALPDSSPAYALGFTRIPTERIGLVRDAYRRSLPRR